MADIERRAFDARIGLGRLCAEAGVSRTVATRWKGGEYTPLLSTIAKLEKRLVEFETCI